jgi:hypothetical protein
MQIHRHGSRTLHRSLYNGWLIGRHRLGKGLLASVAEFIACICVVRRPSTRAGP